MNTQDDALRLIADILDVQDMMLIPETLIKDVPGWDSLAQLHIIAMLEETFHAMIPLEEMLDMETVGDLLKYLY
jgi:acyl carrier protein